MKPTHFFYFGIVVFAMIGEYVLLSGDSSTENISFDKGFTLDAERFDFSETIIRVNQGDTVAININNIDTAHGIFISEYGVSPQERVEFVASTKGEYIFACVTMCGPGHHAMQGKIIVE
jgi:heme/copper-type cytochrome/quinol oxidase subunit 2